MQYCVLQSALCALDLTAIDVPYHCGNHVECSMVGPNKKNKGVLVNGSDNFRLGR